MLHVQEIIGLEKKRQAWFLSIVIKLIQCQYFRLYEVP